MRGLNILHHRGTQSLMSFFIRNCGSVFPCGKFVMDLL